MIILIAGASHTGKTLLAQKLLEEYKFPYLCLDHLKMGLIRSGQTKLTVNDDKELTPYLWNIVKEIIKTAIENKQNLIIEGSYIPFDYKKFFSQEYLKDIKFVCLVMSENYINSHFADIIAFENKIEKRIISSDLTKEQLILENKNNLEMCSKLGLKYYFIDKKYEIEFKLQGFQINDFWG